MKSICLLINLCIFFNFVLPFQHPNIFPVEFATSNETGGLVIRPFSDTGSLRDMICRCKLKGHYLRKYASPKQVIALDMDRIRNFGRQILETLKYMNDKGFPYGEQGISNYFYYKD